MMSIVYRRSVTACLLVIVSFATTHAQERVNYCEASPTLQVELKKVSGLAQSDGGLPYRQILERQLMMVQELLKKFPDDFHLLKLQFDYRRNSSDFDRDALLAEYRTRMNERKGDPASVYFYARLLVGHNTKEAIEQLNKLTQRSPGFPWSYLELAEIYYYPAFRDSTKMHENLKKWMTMCPSLMDVFSLLSRSNDLELMGEAAKSLRARLESSPAAEDPSDWEKLWTLEFNLKPVPEHPQVRRQIAEDLKRLRAAGLNTKEWLALLQVGYRMADDKEGRKWAENEVLRLFPKSSSARSVVSARWLEEHPSPKTGDPREKWQAYYQALLKATYEDRKLWPNDWGFWWSRFNAVRNLENSTGSEIEEAGENLLKALKQNAFEVMMLPPIPLQVAQAYAKRNVATARIPSLVLEGIKATERMEKRNPPSDLYPRKAGDTGNGNLKYVQWLSWPLLAEAYARLGQAEKAREALKEMAEALNRDKPGDQAREEDKLYYSNHQVTYWQTVAKVAEAENRKLDALISYQTALSFRPKSSKPRAGTKDGLADDTSRLWKELGGTDEGLQAYLARNESPKFAVATGEFATWETKVQQLADFNMLDLRGKKWRLADLKGKVTFINLWATYCGPCVDELPYVQKLHEQMKDNKDVLVLTLNLDAEVSRVEAFIRDKKYSFTVIPAEAYAEEMDVFSIPRNWIVSAGGTLQFEYRGFDGNGNEWLKQATEMIRKVQGVK